MMSGSLDAPTTYWSGVKPTFDAASVRLGLLQLRKRPKARYLVQRLPVFFSLH
jgi:hypothetical protein